MRLLPSVDAMLKAASPLVDYYGRQAVTAAIRECLAVLRESILRQHDPALTPERCTGTLLEQVGKQLAENRRHAMRPVFNMTGTILHTNLGRAILPPSAIAAVTAVAAAPVNLEYDLVNGERGERDSHIEAQVCELTGAEAATVVNNNAAAVMLVLNTLALGREVPVSRGELVEIGGSFRIPDVMERSGCVLVEVGTTNRTHIRDMEKAVNSNTALLLKVHASNYRIEGFTAEISVRDLAALAARHDLPLVMDLGSGCLVDLSVYGLPTEPTVARILAEGVDIATFSGDKLLGGPQCGIIAGKRDLVEKIRANPMKRALRLDKMTLAALAEVLKLYQQPESLHETLPALRLFTRPIGQLRELAQRLLPALSASLPAGFAITITESTSQIGSGALPLQGVPSVALAITATGQADEPVRRLAAAMRQLPVPVIGRMQNSTLLLDVRCLEQETEFLGQLAGLQELLQ